MRTWVDERPAREQYSSAPFELNKGSYWSNAVLSKPMFFTLIKDEIRLDSRSIQSRLRKSALMCFLTPTWSVPRVQYTYSYAILSFNIWLDYCHTHMLYQYPLSFDTFTFGFLLHSVLWLLGFAMLITHVEATGWRSLSRCGYTPEFTYHSFSLCLSWTLPNAAVPRIGSSRNSKIIYVFVVSGCIWRVLQQLSSNGGLTRLCC